MKIGIFGHYGNRNLGDEAIIEAAIDSVGRHFPCPEIELFSVNPLDSSRRYNLPAHPIRQRTSASRVERDTSGNTATSDRTHPPEAETATIRDRIKRTPVLASVWGAASTSVAWFRTAIAECRFLTTSLRHVRSLDLLLVTGSNQFLDNFGGPWGFPYTLLKWAVLCRLAGTKLAFVSVGAGPLDARSSRIMIRAAIRLGQYVSYRDKGSRDLVAGNAPAVDGPVYPDLASNLRFERRPPPDLAPPVIGINPMPVYDRRYWCEEDDAIYNAYIYELYRLCSRLMDDGYEVFLFGTQERDDDAIDDVLSHFDSSRQPHRRSASTVQELMDVISSADITVPTRFHATVLSFVAHRPVVGICYYRKASELIDEMGQTGRYVRLEEFRAEDVYVKIRDLERELAHERGVIETRAAEYVDALEAQYAALADQFASASHDVSDSRRAA